MIENPGIRIAKKYGYQYYNYFFRLIHILEKWDNIPIGKNVVSTYLYHNKDFVEIFKKYTENIGIVNIYNTTVHITKNNNEFNIIVYNVDNVYNNNHEYFLKLFFSEFLPENLEKNEHYVVLELINGKAELSRYLYLTESFIFNNGKVYLRNIIYPNSRPIRINNLIMKHDLHFTVKKINKIRIKSLFENGAILYYPKKELNKNYIFIGKDSYDNLYAITKINNKNSNYYIERMKKEISRIPPKNRLALKNHKIQYQFFKMLLEKGILVKETKFPYELNKHFNIPNYHIDFHWFRISKDTNNYPKWDFSPMYVFNEKLVHSDINTRIMNPVLVDYDYDEVNQVLLKFFDVTNNIQYRSILCGLDYKNTLWCIQLTPITMRWRIKNVYKYIYDLDDKTKVFNY